MPLLIKNFDHLVRPVLSYPPLCGIWQHELPSDCGNGVAKVSMPGNRFVPLVQIEVSGSVENGEGITPVADDGSVYSRAQRSEQCTRVLWCPDRICPKDHAEYNPTDKRRERFGNLPHSMC